MAPPFVAACQYPQIFVEQAEKWDSQSVILTREAYGGSHQYRYTRIPYEHVLKKFDADDWPT